MSWAFSKTEVMAPMRHLLSPKTEFLWTQELQKSFEESKAKIVEEKNAYFVSPNNEQANIQPKIAPGGALSRKVGA